MSDVNGNILSDGDFVLGRPQSLAYSVYGMFRSADPSAALRGRLAWVQSGILVEDYVDPPSVQIIARHDGSALIKG